MHEPKDALKYVISEGAVRDICELALLTKPAPAHSPRNGVREFLLDLGEVVREIVDDRNKREAEQLEWLARERANRDADFRVARASALERATMPAGHAAVTEDK